MNNTTNRKVRVMIVDDSKVMTNALNFLFSQDPRLEVVGIAHDVVEARDKLVSLKPDVLTLDLHMPRMDGLTFLKKVMEHFPTRTVIITGTAARNSKIGIEALNAGAVDLIEKPTEDLQAFLKGRGREIRDRIYSIGRGTTKSPPQRLRTAPDAQSTAKILLNRSANVKVVAIASSTGGTHALELFFSRMTSPNLAFVVVQHMPAGFTRSFAERLNDICHYHVVEGQDGEELQSGKVIIAPGDYHMEVIGRAGEMHRYHVSLHQKPLLHGVRPAADYLMSSVAERVRYPLAGIVFTGMGRDGGKGLLQLKQMGALTLAQSEESCVVYGMPKYACEIKAATFQGNIEDISRRLELWAQSPLKSTKAHA